MTRRGAAAVTAAVGIAIWAVVVLHVAGLVQGTDPLRHTVSDLVHLPSGPLVLGLAGVALAVAGAVLAHAAHRAGGAGAAVLLGSWSVAMAVAAVVPTNLPGTSSDLAADVHRWAAAWVFVALPVAVLLLVRGRQGPARALRGPLTGLVTAAAVLGTTFALTHLPIAAQGSPPLPLLGGVERVLYGVVIALLLVTSHALRRVRVPA
jgi:hypothetical protein